MTTFRELVELIKDEKLPKEMLEEYRDKIAQVAGDMQLQLADYLKKEALFMGAKKDGQSIADRKVEWKVTPDGQRLIELKNYLTTAKILLKSLQNRVYSKIY